eukprot:317773_1
MAICVQFNEIDEDSLDDSDREFDRAQSSGISSMEQMMEQVNLKQYRQLKDVSFFKDQESHSKQIKNHTMDCIRSVRPLNFHPCYTKSYVLYIYLNGIKPRIFRTICIPSNISLAVFHDKILTPLFGWKRNFHAYQFSIPHRKNKLVSFGPIYSDSVDMMWTHSMSGDWRARSVMIESSKVYLSDVLYLKGTCLRYLYDLGDRFIHTIVLKDIVLKDGKRFEIEITDGNRNGPPENTNGNIAYANAMNEMIENRDHEKYNEWIRQPNINGAFFDPELFDKRKCKKRMNKYFKSILSTQNAISMHQPINPLQPKTYHRSASNFRDCFNEWCPNRDKKYPENRIKYRVCDACKSAFYCDRKCQKKTLESRASISLF